jgi:WD40 repeat protein
MVASGDDDGVIKLWDVKTGEIMHTFIHHGTIWSLAFSLDNSLLASASLGLDNVRIWNLVDRNELDRINDVPVNSLAFSLGWQITRNQHL